MTTNKIESLINHYNIKVANTLNREPMKINIKFSKSKNNAGVCCVVRRLREANITISTTLANVREEHETCNTIVHELCHAYNDKTDKHGPNWKRIARHVGDSLGFRIVRTFKLSEEQKCKLEKDATLKSPVGIVEVPEIGYKRYIYRKGSGYKVGYKGWSLRENGIRYPVKFTKLR